MYIGKTRLGNIERNYYRRSLSDGGFSWIEQLMHNFWIGSLILMIIIGVSIMLLIGYLVALSTPIFKLEDVSFKGISRVSQAHLLRKGGLENGVNLLGLNLSAVKKKMETTPWVKSVSLQRELPNKLQVVVTEQVPVFLVPIQQNLYFLNEEGFLFKKFEVKEAGLVPLLTGLDKKDWSSEGQLDPAILQELMTIQKGLSQGREPFYPNKLSEIHYDPDCGFSLFTLERGIRITLGNNELPIRIRRLERVWAELEKRPDQMLLKGISLQYGQRVIVHGLRSKVQKKA